MKKVIIFLVIVLGALSLASYLQAASVKGTLWWYSNKPSVVSVDPHTGTLKAVWKGTAQVCAQKSQTDKTVVQCFTVTVEKIGK